ncbi:GNAT family N-acetyltransferase [Janibacter sp. GXQ6167]|uniref:GNAT family N-acetyltransferase n=1 Tax=Janibacter sp. GXQ6167 TaxID=3240791 RepID=UPI003524FE79
MTTGEVDVRPTSARDWEVYRAVRQAMLLDAPDAFLQTFAATVSYGEDTWRSQAAGGPEVQSWLAWRGDLPVGAITALTRDGAPRLVAAWVAGHARGTGVIERLVETAITWAAARGFTTIVLGVSARNPRAVAAYERLGFVDTGERTSHPQMKDCEIHMARAIESTKVNSA